MNYLCTVILGLYPLTILVNTIVKDHFCVNCVKVTLLSQTSVEL